MDFLRHKARPSRAQIRLARDICNRHYRRDFTTGKAAGLIFRRNIATPTHDFLWHRPDLTPLWLPRCSSARGRFGGRTSFVNHEGRNHHFNTAAESAKRPKRNPDGALNILHVFRSPVGGLFRHVVDLSREQAARAAAREVGLIADSHTGGERAESDRPLPALKPSPGAGPHPHSDEPPYRLRRRRRGRLCSPQRAQGPSEDVVHGHGAKGGDYARLALGNKRAVRVYTPHGGSLLFGHDTLAGPVLPDDRAPFDAARGDLFLFESGFSADVFAARSARRAALGAEWRITVSRGGSSSLS